MKILSLKFVLISFLSVILFGCATIPKESIILSEQLSSMINSAQVSHLNTVNKYMAERRNKIDIFMEEKWIPDYMGKVIRKSSLLKDIELAKTESEKGEILLEFTEVVFVEISNKRNFLMNELDQGEEKLKKEIQLYYSQMLVINQSLTAHLRSNSNLNTTRDELLKQFKMPTNEMVQFDKIFDDIDKTGEK